MNSNTTSNTNNENKVPTFDGNRTNFEVFWPKFQAYAKSKGFSSVIKRAGPDPKLPASLYEADGTTRRTLSADEKKAYEKNSKAILALTNAFSTVTLLRVISKTIDTNGTDFEEGKAHEVVKAIMHKYRPDDTVGGLDALFELDALKLDDDMDTTDLFEKIDNLKAVYGNKVLDNNIVIEHIMTTASPVYLNNLPKNVVEKGKQLNNDAFNIDLQVLHYVHPQFVTTLFSFVAMDCFPVGTKLNNSLVSCVHFFLTPNSLGLDALDGHRFCKVYVYRIAFGYHFVVDHLIDDSMQ